MTALHRSQLPWTASSRAGAVAVQALYAALTTDPAAVVLLAGGPEDGGFAAGTADLRATNALVQAGLRRQPAAFARLALRHLLSPVHLLAGRAFDRLVPREATGYVLTIGATPGSPVRGRALLAALEAELAGRGARQVWVDTERSNAAALRFYERAGYGVAAEAFGQVLLCRRLGAAM